MKDTMEPFKDLINQKPLPNMVRAKLKSGEEAVIIINIILKLF